MKDDQQQPGLTMVDAILAIAIIVVVAGFAWLFMSDWRVNARDAQRKSDLVKIKAALIAYAKDNNNTYPTTTEGNTAESIAGQTNQVNLKSVPRYLQRLPTSPVKTDEYAYHYISNNPTSDTPGTIFALLANLEADGGTKVYVVNSDGFSGAVERGSPPTVFTGYSCGHRAGKNVCLKDVP